MSEKKLLFDENMKHFKDEFGVTQEGINTTQSLKGKVRFIDEDSGEVILEKFNTIVLRGRTFALEKLFNDVVPSTSEYIQNLDRKVCLFGIGSGGAPEADPFNPYVPNPTDYVLAKPEPFRSVDTDNPLTMIQPSEAKMYHNRKQVSTTEFEYYSKTFEMNPEWFLDKETNEVYKKITLKVSNKDARGKKINELGLIISAKNDDGSYSDEELFSRICFDTESLKSLSKSLLIEYLIYA